MAPVTVRATGAIGAAAGIAIAVFTYCTLYKPNKNRNFRSIFFNKKKKLKPRKGLVDAIGNTPLIRINSLSEATGCEVSSVLDLFLSSSFNFLSLFHFKLWFFFLAFSNAIVILLISVFEFSHWFYFWCLVGLWVVLDSWKVRVFESRGQRER